MQYMPSEFIQFVGIFQTSVEIIYMNRNCYLALKSDIEEFTGEKITESNKYELAEKYNNSLFKLD